MTSHDDHARPQGASVNTGSLKDWQRLGRQLEDRRIGMGYRFRPEFIQARARILGREQLSAQTVKEIETVPASRRPGSWTPYLLGQLAPLYETTAASMLEVVADPSATLARVPAAERPGLGPSPMTDEERAQATWPYAMRLWKDISDYQAAHPGTPRERIPGTVLFRDAWFASKWDAPPLWMSFEQRIWMLADLLRMADAERGDTRFTRSA